MKKRVQETRRRTENEDKTDRAHGERQALRLRSDWQPKSDFGHIQIGIRLPQSSVDGKKHVVLIL